MPTALCALFPTPREGIDTMALLHGEAISAEEVERVISRQFDARQFASLCNAITWALAGRRCTTLPSFTERVNVADGGIDAEWLMPLPGDGDASPLLGPGWNVCQFKQRDIFTQGRQAVYSKITVSLVG